MAWTDVTPAAFAQVWQTSNRQRWDAPGDLGDQVRRLSRSRVAFPGAPPTAFVGFCSNADRYEDTGAPAPGSRHISNIDFHEVGYFNVEAGYTFQFDITGTARTDQARSAECGRLWRANAPNQCPLRPSPDPNPRHPWTNYARLGTHAYMSQPDFVGHPASLAPGAWRSNLDEQVGVGLLNLRHHGNRVATISGLAASQPGTLWAVFLGFAGWSAGDGTVALHLRPFRAQLEALPGPQRLGALVLMFADAIQNRRARYVGTSHANPVWTTLRALQRLRAGRMLQRALGLQEGWYDLGLGGIEAEDNVFKVLARAACNQPRDPSIVLPPMPGVTRSAGDALAATNDALPAPDINPVDPVEDFTPRELDVPNPLDYMTDGEIKLLQSYGAEGFKSLTNNLAFGDAPLVITPKGNGGT